MYKARKKEKRGFPIKFKGKLTNESKMSVSQVGHRGNEFNNSMSGACSFLR